MKKYAQRVGVIGIKPEIILPEANGFDHLYQAIGLNTGNFMFTNAIYKQIDGNLIDIGFFFDPAIVNNEFDALVLPAANWFNIDADWTWLIDLLDKIEIPIIPIGIGLQADSMDISKAKVSESSVRLALLLSKKSRLISCRGFVTRDWLASIGVFNVVTTGCPSTYMKLDTKAENYNNSDSVILQSTRYWIDSKFLNSNNSNRKLYLLAGQFNLPVIFQSEAEEIDYLVYSECESDVYAQGRMVELAQIYGLSTEIDVRRYLTNRGHVFFNVEKWSAYIKANVGVIGTRLHGAILALNSGRPARLIPHDSRTQELADFSKIPLLNEAELTGLTEEKMRRILIDTDTSEYTDNRARSVVVYRQFLEDCGLKSNDNGII